MDALYPTKTRVALLQDVADGHVYRYPGGMTPQDLNRGRVVNGRIAEMERAGWVRLGKPESPSIYAKRPWELTNSGRVILAANGGEA